MNDEQLIASFHAMWDEFPGMARLIDANHTVLAANPFAEERGFVAGATCAKVGYPSIHRACKLHRMFETGAAQTDNVIPDRIRGWLPVAGRPDTCVHFAVFIPEK